MIQVKFALRSESIQRVEGRLRVEEFLARRLKRQQLLGLRLKFFDAAVTSRPKRAAKQ